MYVANILNLFLSRNQARVVSGVAWHALTLVAGVCGVIALGGCGGGTTGTSPTDSLKFSGFAEQANGARAGSLTMTVRSASSDETLVHSGTDPQGEFEMSLPASESQFVVDVTGVGTASLNRNQVGDGAMSAKLAVSAQGTLTVSKTFEVQVLEGSLCASLAQSGTTLVIVGEVGQERCLVQILTASKELPLDRFEASLFASCDGTSTQVASSKASTSGLIELDLNTAFSRGCVGLSIVVTHPEAAGLGSTFSVE